MKLFYKYLPLLVVIIWACDSGDEQVEADRGLNYFPLKNGLYQIYKVDEIRYSQVAEPETLAYELKTEVIDSFPNSGGGTTYVIHRSTRENSRQPWEFLETWSARTTDKEGVFVEGNVPFVKVIFPLKEGMEWNGNQLNTKEPDEYEVLAYDVPFEVEGERFERTATIEQEFNDDPIVFTDIRKEVYARDVGLIYKETTQLVFCQQQTCQGNELIESGVIYKQQILEYGIH